MTTRAISLFSAVASAAAYALKVPVGGIVIFDDVFSHAAVMRAWLDFKSDQGLSEELNRIDRHSSWFRKLHEVKVDKTKKKPPQDINKLG